MTNEMLSSITISLSMKREQYWTLTDVTINASTPEVSARPQRELAIAFGRPGVEPASISIGVEVDAGTVSIPQLTLLYASDSRSYVGLESATDYVNTGC